MVFQFANLVHEEVMSNDVIISLKNQVATIKTGLDDDTRAVAGGGSGGTKRISIKGGVFRKFVNGKEVAAIEDRHMNVIFTKMAHTASRTYYPGAYKEGEKISPICWSSDSKVPDADVKMPQAKSCDTCQFSVKGSAQGGGAACRLSWRTAVVLPQDPGGDVMQLVLPATSCFGKEEGGKWPFRPYIQMLANNNISAGRVITKMQFDTKSPVPKVLFSPVAAVDESDVEIVAAQRNSAAATAAVKLTVYQTDEAGAAAEAAVAAPATEGEEPKVRESAKKAEPTVSGDMADVVKKWSKK
jgi:hypothetical protein